MSQKENFALSNLQNIITDLTPVIFRNFLNHSERGVYFRKMYLSKWVVKSDTALTLKTLAEVM